MFLFLAHIAMTARAGGDVPLVTAAMADYLFQGTVAGLSECMTPDGSRPWTFVRFNVEHSIVGSGQPASGQPPGTFTIRIPAGKHPDGTFSALVGAPTFSVGDKMIVPVFAASGKPSFLPIFLRGDGAYFRIFPDRIGGSVVTAEGRILQRTSVGRPLPGVVVQPAHATEPGGVAVDQAAVGEAIREYRAGAGYDGSSPPKGDWVGRLRITSTEPVTLSNGKVLPTNGDCNASLSGTYDGTTLSLSGRCNAPRVGLLDVRLDGTWSGTWSGQLRLSAAFDPDIAGEFTWNDHTGSSARDFPDGFTGHTTGARVANSVPRQYVDAFSLETDPAKNVDFIATWDGWRAPLSISDFRAWLGAKAAEQGNAGRLVASVGNTPSNCTSVPLAKLP